MIWQASMTPRLVAVGAKGLTLPRSLHSKCILPALLSVNQDSRHCALRHYTMRFSIILTVDKTGQHEWDCPHFQGIYHQANVVMSPDDTLGLLGWETLRLGHRTRFQVKSANGKSPWEGFPTSHGVQPEIKKVAFLGRDIALEPGIVRYLNSRAETDLNSILHAKRTHLRRVYTPHRPWFPKAAPKDHIKIQSRNFNGTFQDWVERLIYRAKHEALALWDGAPDILAFELGKKPKPILMPADLVKARTIWDLKAILPDSFVEKILDDFYMSKEWR